LVNESDSESPIFEGKGEKIRFFKIQRFPKKKILGLDQIKSGDRPRSKDMVARVRTTG